MKHYKNLITNELYAYEADGSQDHIIPDDYVAITDSEARVLRESIVQNTIDALPYSQKRSLEYPPIGDQLDALFHAGVFPETMAAKIQAVKDKYPKV